MFRLQIEMTLIAAVLFALALMFGAGDMGSGPAPDDGPVVMAPEPEPIPEPEPEPVASSGFSYYASGDLKSGSGTGVPDTEVYAPGITFPVENRPAFLNSQYFNPGGGGGGGGIECTEANYVYPWRDTFCETRWSDRPTRNCPSLQVHRGVDIRAGDASECGDIRPMPSDQHKFVEIVAPEDGYVSHIGSYSLNIRSGPRLYTLIHVNMSDLKVSELENVSKGQLIGYMSNYYTVQTTLHLHLNLQANIDGEGFVHVSPYMSLVRAYEAKLGETGDVVSD